MLSSIGMSVVMPLYVFYVEFIVQENPANVPYLVMVSSVAGFLGVPFWVWLSGHVDKHRAWMGGMLTLAGFSLVYLWLGAGDFWLFDVRPGVAARTKRRPEDYGLERCDPKDLAGGDAEHNARELIRVFTGEDKGAHRDALLMGTSLVLEVQGLAKDALDGVAQAAAAIDDGRAADFLERLRRHFSSQ